jgi:phosphatidylglycerophosphate synthase
MIKQQLGGRLDGWIHTAFPFLFVLPLNPNLLTVIGAIGTIAAAVALASGWFLAGGLLMIASGFFDLVDGVVARHRGVSTRFGAFLDSTLDRLADVAILVGLSVYFARIGDPGAVLLTGLVLTVTVLVSYSAAIAKPLALWILLVGSTVTVAQRFARAYREMERLDTEERESALRT